jgi:hypothetical protein
MTLAMAASCSNASIGNDGDFTVCVTSTAPPPLISSSSSAKKKHKQPPQKQQQQRLRYNLRLNPSTSVEQLRKDVFALFNVPAESTNAYRLSFLGGFPPKELHADEKHTIQEMGIQPNDMLIVKFSLSSVDEMVENGSVGNSNENDSASNVQESTTVGRQKRASAIAATANFRDVIAAQDAILNNTKSSPIKKQGSVGTTIAGFGTSGKRTTVKSNATTSKRPKVLKMEGTGYRLSDGQTVAGSSPSKTTKAKGDGSKLRGDRPMFNSEDDVASKLLSSLGGGGGGNVSHYLRAAMRNAVEKSYEASRASVRVAAVNAGEYSFVKVDSAAVGGEEVSLDDEMLRTTSQMVSYSKGIEGRGYYEEEVEIIGLAVLKSVLESVYNTDSSDGHDDDKVGEGSNDGRLRPVLIAQLSPRAFWSLVYHCSVTTKNDQSTTRPSAEDMLRSTLPQLDWSHLDRGGRMRVLSEKARENLKQVQEIGTASATVQSSSQNHAEEERVKAVEELAESVYNKAVFKEDEDSKLNEREMRVKAAMARFQNANAATSSSASSSSLQPPNQKNDSSTDDWILVTPVEDDIDELIECILEGTSGTTDDDTPTEEIAQSWAGNLLNTVRNWRELANSDPEHILSLFGDNTITPRPSQETIELWIGAARARSIDEIMLDILDGDQDAMEFLLDKARSSTPRDLLLWKTAPGMLLDTISGSTEESSTKKWTKSDVRRWIERAKTALGTCTWLEMYTTQSLP